MSGSSASAKTLLDTLPIVDAQVVYDVEHAIGKEHGAGERQNDEQDGAEGTGGEHDVLP